MNTGRWEYKIDSNGIGEEQQEHANSLNEKISRRAHNITMSLQGYAFRNTVLP